MAAPRYAPEQEVRFAVVMYGGVSLAIYINGVVQELFRLVRATAPAKPPPDHPGPQQAYFEDEELDGTERVYRELGQRLPSGPGAPEKAGADQPVRTRFVVDILSGTSAGGINAIVLGKALAKQQPIDQLRNLWINEGDIADLLEKRRSPGSLLDGARLYELVRKALREMAEHELCREDDTVPAFADQVDLAVTLTDLQGLRLPIRLSDQLVYEPRHRNVLHFAFATEGATGEFRDDFDEGNDPLLAFAARATSSFPFAFEPVMLDDLRRLDDDLEEVGGRFDSFFRDYAVQRADYPLYSFADGGYLDNKPFSYATDALRRRRADFPVERKLIYVEPDPAGDPIAPDTPELEAEPPRERPDAVENTAAALVGLPRTEAIRDDIQAIVDRNRAIERIRRLSTELEEQVLAGDDPLAPLRGLAPELDDSAVLDKLGCEKLCYQAYLRLRRDMVVGQLAAALIRLSGRREHSDEVHAARLLVERWVRAAKYDGRLRALLHRFDVSFRMRRLAFELDRIDELLRSGAAEQDALRALKHALNEVLVDVRMAGRLARSPGADGAKARDAGLDVLRAAVGGLDLSEKLLASVLRQEQAAEPPPGLAAVLDAMAAVVEPALEEADSRVASTLGDGGIDPDLAGRLSDYWERFETFDMVTLPVAYPGLEETNPVDVIRIAPEDATALISEGAKCEHRRKLAGTAVGNFGGFLHEGWRRNDMMWGRLDAAERIISTLVPDAGERGKLISRAHAAIIREELVDEDACELTDRLAGAIARPGAQPAVRATVERLGRDGAEQGRAALRAALKELDDEVLLDHFRATYEVPRELDPKRTLGVAGRGARITGDVLDGIAKRRSLPATPAFWLSRFGRLVWGLAEVAIPGGRRASLKALSFRYWNQLAVLLSVLLILMGVVGVEEAQKAGWLLLGGSLAVQALVWLAGAAMTKPERGVPSTEPEGGGGGAAIRRELSKQSPRAGPALALAGFALVLAGLAVDVLQPVGWAVLGAGVLVWLGVYVLSARHARRLRLAVAAAFLLALLLAAVELARHGGEDLSAAVGALWGDSSSGVEGAVRDAWDWFEDEVWSRLWPWD